jgi:lipopolysaccharide transport system ATP-binding protein
MSDTIIEFDGIGKSYMISHHGQRDRYVALRDVLAGAVRNTWRRCRDAFYGHPAPPRNVQEEFWALRDVSFEIKRGEVVGVIGRNGAGKSTLLKIISRITEPTEGRGVLNGRVASLLEVGTGFHPELTGRENVYLNGAVLGMTRAEIRRKFDEIVAFAEIERFLDTPVKRYSSGMYIRLAFAVAAHLEPEILVIDEVLAVGDAAFQKKCLGKMDEVAKGGRTVLFVSHNMGIVQLLCSRAVLLNQGRVADVGAVGDVISKYLTSLAASNSYVRPNPSSKPVSLRSAAANVEERENSTLLITELIVDSNIRKSISVELRFFDNIGAPVGCAPVGTFDHVHEIPLVPGENRIRSVHDISFLATGSYQVSIDITESFKNHERAEHCIAFEMISAPRGGAYRRLPQEWGYGSFQIPRLIEPIGSGQEAP